MRKIFLIKWIIFPLLFMPVIFGCSPGIRKDVVGPKKEIISAPILPVEPLERKIASLEELLDSKELDDEGREITLSLLSDYKTILSALSGEGKSQDYQTIIRILFNNLDRLDERYLKKRIRADSKDYSNAIKKFSLKRDKILDHYLSGNYEGVVDECVSLEATFGPDSLTPDIGLLFAISLAKRDRLTDAVNIGEKITRELEGRPDLIHLRAGILEWQLHMGNREKAQDIFDKLMDNMDEREAILRRAEETFRGADREIARPRRIPPPGVPDIEEPDSIQALLREVDRLVKKGAFLEAKMLLLKKRLRIEEGPEAETIDQAMKTVELAEERHQMGITHKKETLEQAVKLIEEENFEEAITKLDEIGINPDVAPDSEKLKDIALEKLIHRERNRAAKIFLMAKNTDDLKKREKLLVLSYNILKGLIDKYPRSSLVNKLHDHLEKVKAELDKFSQY